MYAYNNVSGKVMMPKDHTGSEHMGHPKSYSMDSNHRRSKDTPDGEVMNIRTPEVEADSGQFSGIGKKCRVKV